MAEATSTVHVVEKIIKEEEKRIVLTLSPEEARTIYDVLYLTEMRDYNSPSAKNIRSSRLALGTALVWPDHMLRVDLGHSHNGQHTIYLFERQ